jgi:invasion protein IalB
MVPITMRLIICMTGMLLPLSAIAQTAPAAPKPTATEPKNVELPTQGWVVTCAAGADGMNCRATQSIGVPQTQQLLAAVSIFKAAGTPAGHAMSLHLPHGLFLPAGANVQIDADTTQSVTIETCDQRGCYANFLMPEKMFAAMRKGKMLAITFQNTAKNNVRVQLTLEGFPEALKKL